MSLIISNLKSKLKEILEGHLKSEVDAILSAEKDLLAAAESEQSDQSLNLESKNEEMLETLEKHAQQADRIAEQRKQFDNLNWNVGHNEVRLGAIATTTLGNFFVGIPAGQLSVEGQMIMCISTEAPIYKVLMNKGSGEEFVWQGQNHRIEDII